MTRGSRYRPAGRSGMPPPPPRWRRSAPRRRLARPATRQRPAPDRESAPDPAARNPTGPGASDPAGRPRCRCARENPGHRRSACACRAGPAGPGWSRPRTPPWNAPRSAGGPPPRCGRRAWRTASAPRSLPGPCSAWWPNRRKSCGPCSSSGGRRPAPGSRHAGRPGRAHGTDRPKRSAAGGARLARARLAPGPAAMRQALENGVVLAVDGQHSAPLSRMACMNSEPAATRASFVGQQHAFARPPRPAPPAGRPRRRWRP